MSREPDRITRRTVLRGAAVAGAATLVPPGAGVASAGARAPAGVFSRYVGDLAAATTTAPVDAPRPFTLVGAQWRSPAGPRIELRTRGPSTGGRWSPWVRASVRGHEPDQARRAHRTRRTHQTRPHRAGPPARPADPRRRPRTAADHRPGRMGPGARATEQRALLRHGQARLRPPLRDAERLWPRPGPID